MRFNDLNYASFNQEHFQVTNDTDFKDSRQTLRNAILPHPKSWSVFLTSGSSGTSRDTIKPYYDHNENKSDRDSRCNFPFVQKIMKHRLVCKLEVVGIHWELWRGIFHPAFLELLDWSRRRDCVSDMSMVSVFLAVTRSMGV